LESAAAKPRESELLEVAQRLRGIGKQLWPGNNTPRSHPHYSNDLAHHRIGEVAISRREQRQRRDQAIALLTHIQNHFWPMRFQLRRDLYRLTRAETELNAVKEYLSERLKSEPSYWELEGLILDEYQFPFMTQKTAISRAIENDPGDSRLRKLLERAYLKEVEKRTDLQDLFDLYDQASKDLND